MSQQQKIDLQAKGLYTAPNNLSGVPQGAFEVADNVVINYTNLVSSRRGQTQYGTALNIGTGQVDKLFNYASSLIASYDSKLAYDSGNGVWVQYSGTYAPPSSGFRIRSLEAQRNFYFTTSAGVYKIDSLTSDPRVAGVPRALNGTYTLSGSTGFLQDDTAVAYRMVWGYVDENNNLILGAPSQRLVVPNPTVNPADVSLTFTIPSGITTEYFYQIYRSQATATATDEPNDELQLVIQGNPTAAEIAAKSFTTLDITPFSLMRAFLYTSPSVEGISQANNEPPFAIDMDVYKGYAFYANTRQKQRLTLTLISVDLPSFGYYVDATVDTSSGSDTLTNIADTSDLRVGMRIVGTGIPIGTTIIDIPSGTSVQMSANATATGTVSVEFQDRFSIGGIDYFGGSAENISTDTFLVATAGTPAQNINDTALSLINVINKSTSNTLIYAYYVSSLNDLPGQILFEERSIGGSAFLATSTAGQSFSPSLPVEKLITAISIDDPTEITSVAHGLSNGDRVTIYNSNSTPSVNGSWTVTVIDPDTFSIPIEVTGAGTTGFFLLNDEIIQSDNEERQNRVAISKQGQVEAVPALNFVDIGSANFPIQRVLALRDGIFFFKLDGIFRLSGETISNFTVTLVDNTTALLCPESAVPFNNQIFCFTDQGICAVSDSGVEIKSVPIEGALLELSSEQYTNFTTASFGVAYESSRQYMFFTVSEESDTFATQAFVYSSLTNSWTRWIMSRTCGIVSNSIDKLFMAEPTTGQVLIERKNYNNTDFADKQYSINIATVSSTTQLIVSSATNLEIGMSILQNDRTCIITAINGNALTTTPVNGFVTGAATAYQPILNRIKYAPIDCENPGILKQFCEISMFFKNAAFQTIDLEFGTNIAGSTRTVTVRNTSNYGWGNQNWGQFPWGGNLGGQAVLRTYVPREQQRGSWLTLTIEKEQAFTGFSLQGTSLMFNAMSSRIK